MRGDIVDLESRELLTENRKRDLKQAKLASLNEDDMIIYGDKSLPYQVTVFTDIDCGYCRKLHSQIKEYNEEGQNIPQNTNKMNKVMNLAIILDKNA